MKNILTTCLVGLVLVVSVPGQDDPRRASQPGRKTGEQRRQPRLVFKKSGVEIPSTRLLSRMEKLADPKDDAKKFDFKVEVVDVGGLDVVKQVMDEEYNYLFITVRNKGAVTPKEDPYLFVRIEYVRTYGGWLPKPMGTYTDGTTMPRLKPGEEFVFKIDLIKKGIVFKPYGGNHGWPQIGTECYIVSGPIAVDPW